MIVESRLIDAVLLQARHHCSHFALQQDQITHHHRVIGNPLEGHPRSESQRGLERDSVYHHVKIAARKADPHDSPRTLGALSAERVLDSAPVGFCRLPPLCPSVLSRGAICNHRSNAAEEETTTKERHCGTHSVTCRLESGRKQRLHGSAGASLLRYRSE